MALSLLIYFTGGTLSGYGDSPNYWVLAVALMLLVIACGLIVIARSLVLLQRIARAVIKWELD